MISYGSENDKDKRKTEKAVEVLDCLVQYDPYDPTGHATICSGETARDKGISTTSPVRPSDEVPRPDSVRTENQDLHAGDEASEPVWYLIWESLFRLLFLSTKYKVCWIVLAVDDTGVTSTLTGCVKILLAKDAISGGMVAEKKIV